MLVDRRCLKCGASVRRELEACPQCGTSMSARNPNTASNDLSSPNEIDMWQVRKREPPARLDAAKAGERELLREREARNINQQPEAERATTTRRIEVFFDQSSPRVVSKSDYAESAISDGEAKRIEKLNRVDDLKLPPKIEARINRFRETSNRLMDETAASSDASLRFVLIATVLVVITVTLLFINYTMR